MIQIGALVAGKGGMNALDDLCDTRDTLAVGVGKQLHDGRVHPYPAGNRNRCGVDQNNSGTKTSVNDLHVLSCRSYIYRNCQKTPSF